MLICAPPQHGACVLQSMGLWPSHYMVVWLPCVSGGVILIFTNECGLLVRTSALLSYYPQAGGSPCVELDRKPTWVPNTFWGSPLVDHCGETCNEGSLYPWATEQVCACQVANVVGDLQEVQGKYRAEQIAKDSQCNSNTAVEVDQIHRVTGARHERL